MKDDSFYVAMMAIDEMLIDDNPVAEQAPTVRSKSGREQRARIFAALSDPTRLGIVELLAEVGELSGSEIANRQGISLALFCHHSKTLSEAGVIDIRREGQTKYSSLNRELLKNCFTSFRGLDF